MNKVVIVDKIYLRKAAFYESEFLDFYFSFGDRVYSNDLFCVEGDFDYVEVSYGAYKGFLPLEYLIDEDIFFSLKGSFLSRSDLLELPYSMTDYKKVYISKVVYPYLCNMFDCAKEAGIFLSIMSGYRGVRDISSTFVYEYEELFMQRLIEKPYFSVYHNGDVLDISSSEINNRLSVVFYTTRAYKWLLENASLFNFRLSLPPCVAEDVSTWKPWRIYFDSAGVSRDKASDFISLSFDLYFFSRSLVVHKQLGGVSKDFKYIFLHNSEHTARRTARYGIDTYGGILYELINAGERNIELDIGSMVLYYDPNRIFTSKGLRESLTLLNEGVELCYIDKALRELLLIRDNFLKLLDISDESVFISLHTNNRCSDLSVFYFRDAGGSFSVYINSLHNPKNFFYTIREQDFIFFSSRGYNTVLQREDILCDDGSLSILMSRVSAYFLTIEVQEGYFAFQREMFDLAVYYFRDRVLGVDL